MYSQKSLFFHMHKQDQTTCVHTCVSSRVVHTGNIGIWALKIIPIVFTSKMQTYRQASYILWVIIQLHLGEYPALYTTLTFPILLRKSFMWHIWVHPDEQTMNLKHFTDVTNCIYHFTWFLFLVYFLSKLFLLLNGQNTQSDRFSASLAIYITDCNSAVAVNHDLFVSQCST